MPNVYTPNEGSSTSKYRDAEDDAKMIELLDSINEEFTGNDGVMKSLSEDIHNILSFLNTSFNGAYGSPSSDNPSDPTRPRNRRDEDNADERRDTRIRGAILNGVAQIDMSLDRSLNQLSRASVRTAESTNKLLADLSTGFNPENLLTPMGALIEGIQALATVVSTWIDTVATDQGGTIGLMKETASSKEDIAAINASAQQYYNYMLTSGEFQVSPWSQMDIKSLAKDIYNAGARDEDDIAQLLGTMLGVAEVAPSGYEVSADTLKFKQIADVYGADVLRGAFDTAYSVSGAVGGNITDALALLDRDTINALMYNSRGERVSGEEFQQNMANYITTGVASTKSNIGTEVLDLAKAIGESSDIEFYQQYLPKLAGMGIDGQLAKEYAEADDYEAFADLIYSGIRNAVDSFGLEGTQRRADALGFGTESVNSIVYNLDAFNSRMDKVDLSNLNYIGAIYDEIKSSMGFWNSLWRGLGNAIVGVGSNASTVVDNSKYGIGTAQEENPDSLYVNSSSPEDLTHYATGGYVSSPEIAVVGDSSEYIIPVQNADRERSVELLTHAANDLGVSIDTKRMEELLSSLERIASRILDSVDDMKTVDTVVLPQRKATDVTFYSM